MRLLRVLVVVAAAALLVAGNAPGAEKPYLIHGGLGYTKVLNEGAPGGSFGLNAGLIYRLQGTPKIGIGGEVGYYMLGQVSVEASDGVFSFAAQDTWSCIPMTGQLYYIPSSSTGAAPVLTVGVGFYPIKIKEEAEASAGAAYAGYTATATNTDFGINFGGGLRFGSPRSQVQFGADARLHIIMTDIESTQLIAIMGRIYF